MKTNNLIILLGFCIFSLGGYSQSQLTKQLNCFRSGDRLLKQQLEYKDPGESGKEILWDFQNLKPVDDCYELKYYSFDDSLMIGQEHRTLYKYIIQGDSLLCTGFENRSMEITNHKPELLLLFPATFGSRSEDYFYGNGDYCNQLFCTTFGKSSIEVDGYGTLVMPEGDTIRNVLRTHQVKLQIERKCPYPLIAGIDTIYCPDSIDYHLATDTLSYRIDVYRWYAEGYRYPVFEMMKRSAVVHTQLVDAGATAFSYTPVEQYYGLEDDVENRKKREKLTSEEYGSNESDNSDKQNNGMQEPALEYDMTMTGDGNEIVITYHLNVDGEVRIMLFDIQSRQLSGSVHVNQPAGSYQETISISALQPGEYTLRIMANGEIFGEKFIK